MTYIDHFYMDYLGQNRYVGILQYAHEGITFYFIDNEEYYNGSKPYGDWYHDLEKFCFFSPEQPCQRFRLSDSSRMWFTVMTGRPPLFLFY